jgi:hypothetical protein
MARFRRQGAAGLVSGKRGKHGNHRLPTIYTDHILDLVREHYPDFGPTLAREKLLERHGLLIGRETCSTESKSGSVTLFFSRSNEEASAAPAARHKNRARPRPSTRHFHFGENTSCVFWRDSAV